MMTFPIYGQKTGPNHQSVFLSSKSSFLVKVTEPVCPAHKCFSHSKIAADFGESRFLRTMRTPNGPIILSPSNWNTLW